MGQSLSKSETFDKTGADSPHHHGDHPEGLGFKNQLFELSSWSLLLPGHRSPNTPTPSPSGKVIQVSALARPDIGGREELARC